MESYRGNSVRPRWDGPAVAAGIWLRLGAFGGAGVALGAVVGMIDGGVRVAPGLAAAAGGALLCAYSLRRAWCLLGGKTTETPPDEARGNVGGIDAKRLANAADVRIA